MSPEPTVTPEQVISALRLWHGGDTQNSPLENLRLYKNADTADVLRPGEQHTADWLLRNRAVLFAGINKLAESDSDGADLLLLRFEDEVDARKAGERLGVSEQTIYYRQREAIKKLSAALNQLEEDSVELVQADFTDRLPLPTYTELFGVSEFEEKLFGMLSQNAGILRLIAIDGLGESERPH